MQDRNKRYINLFKELDNIESYRDTDTAKVFFISFKSLFQIKESICKHFNQVQAFILYCAILYEIIKKPSEWFVLIDMEMVKIYESAPLEKAAK